MKAKNMKELHKIVCERDNYQCQGYRDNKHSPQCKVNYNYPMYFNEDGVNKYVCAAHIVSRGADITKALDPFNCRTLSMACHELEHRGVL
jgi:hypothetical protein